MGTRYQTDPVLQTIDVDELPSTFLALPDDEQRWRGRLYLMTLWASHNKAYSWDVALTRGHENETDWKKIIDETPDERILAAMRGYNAEVAVESGAGLQQA